VNEADIPADSQPPINARQGLLFEWWSVFWTLFTAKNNGTGSDEALIYTQVGFFDPCYAFTINDQSTPTHPTVPSTAIGSSHPESQPAPAATQQNDKWDAASAGCSDASEWWWDAKWNAWWTRHAERSHELPHVKSTRPPTKRPRKHPRWPATATQYARYDAGAANNWSVLVNFRRGSISRLTQGGVPQPQQPGQGMVQMQGNQHMGQNRTMLPPNGPPNMGNHVPGNQQQAHSPNYPQQLGRPSSRPSTPGQGVMTNPSPSMAHRLPPGVVPQSINDINAEFMRIPNTFLPKLKQDLMISQEKDVSALTGEEKVDSCILQSAFLFTVPISTGLSVSIAQGLVPSPSPSPDPVHPNNRLTLPVLPRHLSWHRRTFATTTTTPQINNGQSGTAHLLVKRKVLPQSGRVLLRAVVITQTLLVRPKANLRWRLWLLSILRWEVAHPDPRTCKTA